MALIAPIQIDAGAVRQAKLDRMRQEASEYNEVSLGLEESTKPLFGTLRKEILSIGTDILEIFRIKMRDVPGVRLFEVIPSKQHLTLLFNMDFEDCDEPSQLARDASNKAFIINASEEGGVLVHLWSEEDIPAALHIARQAYEQVAE